MIAFFVPGTPRPKQSYRAKKGGGYTHPRIKAWQDAVGWAAREHMQGAEPLVGNVQVDLIFHVPDKRKRDLDNLSKAVLDGCNGIVWDDDQQVTRLYLEKDIDKENEGVMVTVKSLEWHGEGLA